MSHNSSIYKITQLFYVEISITIVGFFIGLPTIIIGVLSYYKKVKLDQVRFVKKIYDEFNSDDINNLYSKIFNKEIKNIKYDSPDESTLCKILTIFDNIWNYYEQGIINNKVL